MQFHSFLIFFICSEIMAMLLPDKLWDDVIMINHRCLLLRLHSNLIYSTYNMIENLAYVIMGFAATYLSLEVAWHFTACRLKDNGKIKPYMFTKTNIKKYI